MLENTTNQQETSNLIAKEKSKIRENSLVEIRTQTYVSGYLIYRDAGKKSKCEKCLQLMRKVDGDLAGLSESFIKNKE